MNQRRKQLTLFVDETQSKAIEKIRLAFNPKQYALIKRFELVKDKPE